MIEPGLEASVVEEVTPKSTAEAIGSGDVPVLGTPALLALIEGAAIAAVATSLESGSTTVGARIKLDHVAPTPVGATVTATARLEAVEGRRLTFSFEARDAAGLIARGTHLRVIVDREGFLDDAATRSEGG
ncbi:MAG: thioesterase family protein [Actinomycetota bacterium]